IGDVGRPDLLGANGWSAEELARALFRSTREKLLTLPDATGVFPAHGAGSACGKNLSSETTSTIGEQRRTNYALAPMSEDEFVAAVCEGQSTAPMYFAYASVRNRQQRPTLDEEQPVPALSAAEALAAQAGGAVLLDTRDPQDFATGHLRGSVNVGLGGRFAEMAGQVLTADDDIVLVSDPGTEVEARIRLARIGFDGVVGHLAGGAAGVGAEHLTAASRLTAVQVAAAPSDVQLIDVRGPGEVRVSGAVPGADLVPLPELVGRVAQFDPAKPTIVYCAGGYRSSIAASPLRGRGFTAVCAQMGGLGAWDGGCPHLLRATPA
ncbi:MAG: MBL fold metallo-hydrolase, partial [Pseudonocardia sp.]|nr:MBL fold metallo-hydrolase [Pseudonocardia sp.]